MATTTDSLDLSSLYAFGALLLVFCAWTVFYLFFSAWVLGMSVSFLLNTLVLQGKSAVQIRAIHFALLRGMIVLRDVTYTTPNFSIKMVDCVLTIPWWRAWSKTNALLQVTSRGIEYYILNNSGRYEDLDRILKKRERGAQDQGLHVGLDVPPDAPLLFWLSKIIVINLSVGCVIIGNPSLPTALVISFQKARGTASLVEKELYTELQRVEACIDLHECTVQVRENKGWKNDADAHSSGKKSVWQSIETWQYWEGLSALKEGLVAPLNFLRVRGENAESSPDSSGRLEQDESVHMDTQSAHNDSQHHLGAPGEERRGHKDMGRGGGERQGGGGRGLLVGDDHVLKSPLIQLKYYDDLCGYIAEPTAATAATANSLSPQTTGATVHPRVSAEGFRDVVKRTEDVVPERGILLEVAHASLVYGPWEDRQRAWLQGFFTPADFETREPHTRKSGYVVNRSAFHTIVTFRGSVRLHVPFSRDCSARESDFASVHARTEGCAQFLTLTSGTSFYQHPRDTARRSGLAAREGSFSGKKQVHTRDTAGAGSAVGGVAGKESGLGAGIARDANGSTHGSHDPAPSYRHRNEKVEAVHGREREVDWEGEEEEDSDSETDYSNDSRDSDQSYEESEWSEHLDEGVDEEWSEIIARSGVETLPVVGNVRNIVPWWMGTDGSVMTTDVEIFRDVRIASSIPSALEDGVFWKSEGLKVLVKMKSGLAYHDKSSMEYDVVSSRSTVRMLRDHGRLITAVLADWGWRPNIKQFNDRINDALYFVPSCVKFNLTLVKGFKLGLILNDENVVDDFADSKNNSILWLRANTLAVKTCTPNDTFQPAFGCTQYSVHVPDVSGWLGEKQPNSIDMNVTGPFPDCLTAAAMNVNGSYTGWRPSNSMDVPLDTSCVNIDLKQLTVLGHGIVIKGLQQLIRNYFDVASFVITRNDFEATVRSDFEKAHSCPERSIPGWNSKMQAFQKYNAAKKVRPHPCENSLRVSLTDMVLELPQHESMTAARLLCAYVMSKEVLIELRSMPDFSQLVVNSSSITLQCVPSALPSSPTTRDTAFFNARSAKKSAANADKNTQMPRTGNRDSRNKEPCTSGLILIDRVEYSTESCLGPQPEQEVYKTHTHLRVGRIDGEVSPAQVLPLVGAMAQLTARREAIDNHDSTHLPGKLWIPNLAHSIFEVSMAPIHLTSSAPTFLADFSLARGLSMKGNNLVCSLHNTISTLHVPALSASLHQRVAGPSATPREASKSKDNVADGAAAEGDSGGTEAGVGRGWARGGEEVIEVGRLETSVTVSWTNKSSNWQSDCLEQYNFLLSQDRDTQRHGLHDKMNEAHDNYYDADEPTQSVSEDDRPTTYLQSERTSEVFLTADDFVTSEHLTSATASSSDDDFESPNAEFLNGQRKREDDFKLPEDDDSEDAMYSAPTTPLPGRTPRTPCIQSPHVGGTPRSVHTPRTPRVQTGKGGAGGMLAGSIQGTLPYLARGLIVEKSVVRSSLSSIASCAPPYSPYRGARRRLQISVANLQQLQREDIGGGGGARCPLDQYRIVRGLSACANRSIRIEREEAESAPVRYGWHLHADPMYERGESDLLDAHVSSENLAGGVGKSTSRHDSVPSMPTGGWSVTAALQSGGASSEEGRRKTSFLRYLRSTARGSSDSEIVLAPCSESSVPLRGKKNSVSSSGSDDTNTGVHELHHARTMPAAEGVRVCVFVCVCVCGWVYLCV